MQRIDQNEVLDTLRMIRQENLDIRTITTVSYTHLDVYKRQGRYRTLENRLYSRKVINELTPLLIRLNGRDVYKRQA